jgi:hypothetical protein
MKMNEVREECAEQSLPYPGGDPLEKDMRQLALFQSTSEGKSTSSHPPPQLNLDHPPSRGRGLSLIF